MRQLLTALATLVCVAVFPSIVQAQTDYSSRTATASLTAGLHTAFGASMIVDPPEGQKVSAVFAYHIDAASTYPLTPVISACLNFGFENRGFKLRNESNSDIYGVERISYFSIAPGFRFSAFYIGMNFGLPMGGTLAVKTGQGTTETSRDLTSAEEDKLETLLEPRLGAVIPLMEDPTGWLGLTVTGGYTLNEVEDRGDDIPESAGAFNMVAAYLGLTYQFAIPGTARQ